ncbi:MAG: hypothetical protein Q8L54_03845 [Devosia sp.]|nr:hypothetical protein [Devosia sp.]
MIPLGPSAFEFDLFDAFEDKNFHRTIVASTIAEELHEAGICLPRAMIRPRRRPLPGPSSPGSPIPSTTLGEEHLALAEAMRDFEGVEARMRDWYAVA